MRDRVSAKSCVNLGSQLSMNAQKRRRRLRGFRQLAGVVADVKFVNGIEENEIGRIAA